MNPFDQFDSAPTSSQDSANPFDQFDASAKPKKQNKGIAGDLVTDLKRGIEQLPSIVTGLADIPIAAATGETYADKTANALGGITGFAPAKWAKEAEAEYSPGRVAAKSNVDQAWEDNKTPFADAAGGDFAGIGQVAKAYIQNPQQLVGSVVESLPSMLGGAKVGQAVTKAAGIAAPWLAGAGGEGAVMAGQQMNQLTEAGADPRTAAAASAATGVAGAAIGAFGGKLAQRLGVVDPDTALAGGATRALTDGVEDQSIKSAIKEGAKRIAGGAASEGLFEELPQSVLEQVLSNLAQGKPWEEGVGRSAVEGTLAGSLMGGAFNALPGKKEEPAPTPPAGDEPPTIAGLLPAPTYTGTPGERIVAADSLRQDAIDAADAANQKLWEERDAYAKWQEELKRNNITIINDPAPLQQRIDALMGINESRLQGIARTNYEKAIENAFGEQVGIVVGKDGLEVPFTMADYLKSKIAVGDMERKGPGKPAASAGIAAAPVIPVVGPLSNVANLAVQSGAHQATVMQQAAAQAAENTSPEGKAGTPAGAQPKAAAPAQGPLTEIAAQAPAAKEPANVSAPTQAAPQADQANAPNAGAKATEATGDSFIRTRTNAQLNWLAERGKPEFKAAAAAEIKARAGDVSESVPALNAADSVNAPTDMQIPMSEQKQTVTDVPLTNEGDTNAPRTIRRFELGRLVSDSIGQTSLRPSHDKLSAAARRFGVTLNEARRALAAFNNPEGLTAAGRELVAFSEAANQEPVKNETPAAATVSAESVAPNQEPIKKIGVSAITARQPKGPEARDDLVGAILRVTGGKGVAAHMAQTIVGDTANNATKVRGLFTNAGIADLDDTADLLRTEEGFDVRDGNHLSELIRQQADGSPVYSMERAERDAADNAEKQHRNEIRKQAKKFGIKQVARKFSAIEEEVFRRMGQRHDEAVAKLDARAKSRFDAMLKHAVEIADYDEVDAIITDAQNRFVAREFLTQATKQLRGYIDDLTRERQAKEQSNATEEDQGSSAEPDWLSDNGRGTEESSRGGDAAATPEGARGEAGQQGAESLTLEGQTNAQAAAEFKRQQEEAAKKDEAPAAPTVKADQVDLFATQSGLFNSNRDAAPEANKISDADLEKRITIAADSIDKLRKVDVERVLTQGNIDRQQMADYIKRKRPELAAEVDEIIGETSVAAATVDAEKSAETKPSEMDALKAEMGQAIGELASILGAKQNLTPEEESRIIPVMSKIFRIAAKMGYIKFKDAAKYVIDQIRQLAGADVADKISIENLQAGYINIAKEIGGDKREAMTYDSIEDLEKSNVTDERSGADLESDSGNAGTEIDLGKEGVRTGRGGDGGTGRPGVQGSEESLRAGRGSELSGPEAAAAGERGNLEIYTGATELSPGSAGNSVDSGSRDSGLAGAPVEPNATEATRQSATSPNDLKAKQFAQVRADKSVEHKAGIAAIRAALPILTENQQDDVAKAEDRFAVPDGYGMLFTNGTGTGKTFTGLGVIKRFANAGKTNTLIVAPNDKIIEDWQKSGKLLGLDLSRLDNTNDAGKGVVITTYANMGQNNALASRDWDLVVHDEAHYLAMDKDGTNTNALKNLRAITLHPDGVFHRHSMLSAADIEKLKQLDADAKMQRMSDDQRDWTAAEKTQADADNLRNELKAKQDAIKEDVASRQGEQRTRALFLSATPFAYEKTVDWANGYIFDYNEGRSDESREFRGYNAGSNSDQFMMQHFGYRMRYGKLTQPDAKVDSGLMQRQFNSWLKKKGSLSGRMLDVSADYDRRFILVDSAIGQRIDEALQWFDVKRKAQHEGAGEAGERIGAIMAKADPYATALGAVRDHIGEKFDYLSRRYLLESIKAREVVPHIREHLALGRKIVVFHDYKKGGGFNPFILGDRSVKEQESDNGLVAAAEWNKVVREFNAEFRDIINSDLFKQSSPIDMFKQEFPNVLLFNGDVPQKQRRANVAKFQDDASGPQVILVQSAAGKEGISLHDTTGKHQRVLFNLGQPTAPTTAIQEEGRIYRTGQVTDAIFRYLNTGTNWEKWAFATTIAQRASAAENLGMGEQARALKDAFISGFEESGDYRAGMENEGKGGKERDKAANDALTEYDRARAFYFGTQKKTSKTKAQEGADYFATPEPVGLKMVEWADIRPGEKVLEPSAGHGAIARWIPSTADRSAIEPSMALRPRLAMVFDGQIIDSDFESMNVVNKFDAIVMNPPFGSGGKTAVDHLAKAATHLREGGRIVALLPTGPAADKKFEKWMYEGEERAVKPIYEHTTLGPIYRGDTVETNASWMKEGVITRKDKEGNLWFKREGATGESAVAYQAFKSVKPTGQRTARHVPFDTLHLIADIKMPAVTFERAGTQVMTRVVVIEKQLDATKAPDTRGAYNRDFTNAEDINDLFDQMENMALPGRAKEQAAEEATEESPSRKAKPAPAKVGDVVTVNGNEYAIEIYTTNDGKDKRGIWMEEKEAKEINPRAFKSSKMRGTPAEGKFFVDEYWLSKRKPDAVGNIAAPSSISPADKAIYGMSAEGKSAAEILKFIASASRNPFNRQVAKLLLKTGIAPSVTVGDGKGWKMNAGEGNKYAAGYNPKTDTISLFRPASAERNMLHEMMHAATLKALAKKGMASAQMNALYAHVKKTGKLKGMYGMSDVDEFIAEAFTNPNFQDALKKIAAPQASNALSSAWHWFTRIVKGILGLPENQQDALSAALENGLGVMRENMKLSESDGAIRYATGPKQTDSEAFRKWFGVSKVVDANREPLVVYHGTNADFSEFKTTRGGEFGPAVYFTDSPREAGEYGEAVKGVSFAAPSAHVMPMFVRIENPYTKGVDAFWKEFGGAGSDAAGVERAKSAGYDGVIAKRADRYYDNDAREFVDRGNTLTHYIAFDKSQAKSAIGNNGDFDGSNPDIRYNVADEGWSIAEPSKMDDVIYALQDKQIDMKRVMQSIMKTGKQIKDNFNPYLQEELFHGRASKGVKDFLDFELRPLLREMQQGNIDMGDFEEYLWNAHAQERNEQIAKVNPEMKDGGSGIKTADAKTYLAALSPELRGKYQALAARVNAINKASQQALVESGLEKQSTIDAWNGAYKNYVPLQREDVDSGHVGTGKGFSIRGSSTKRALGSGRKVVDIIANLTMQRERNIVRAEKNRVSLAVRGLAIENPNSDFWTVDQAPKERVIENKAIYTVMDGEGRPNEFTRMADAEKFARSIPGANIEQTWQDRVTERVVPGFSSRDNVLLARVNGEDKYVIFNERDARALRMVSSLKNLDMDNMGRVLSIVGKATRYLASINTQYNPVFGVINLIRDAQGALINLSSTPLAGDQKRVLGYTVDALRGIYADIRAHRKGGKPSSKWAALFEEFQQEGGQTGYRDQYANAEARAESIVSELGQFNEGKAKQFTRGVFGWLSDYNETMENAVRLAAYKAATEKGMSKQQAASLAKNITVNFNRKGQVATQVGALYAFFNASVQGSARLAETLFEMKDGDIRTAKLSKAGKKIVYGGILLGSMQALLLAAAGFDDDEPPEFIRERNLILPIGDGKYLTLAMPLGFHVIPGIGRIATEFVLGGGKDPLKHMASFASMFAESFNPIGSAGFSLQTITPSVVDPFAALAENRDFTGKEIYRENMNPMNPTPGHARAKDVATFYSKAISEGLNLVSGGSEFRPGAISWSPDSIDYLVGQVTGGVGREVNKLFQTGRAASTGEELPLYKIPLVGRFVGDTEGQSGQSQKFYDAIRQINGHEAEYKGLLKDGRRQEANEYLADNPAVRLIMAGNHAEATVRKLRSAKRDLIEKEAEPDQIRAIEQRITSAMQNFNERAKGVI